LHHTIIVVRSLSGETLDGFNKANGLGGARTVVRLDETPTLATNDLFFLQGIFAIITVTKSCARAIGEHEGKPAE